MPEVFHKIIEKFHLFLFSTVHEKNKYENIITFLFIIFFFFRKKEIKISLSNEIEQEIQMCTFIMYIGTVTYFNTRYTEKIHWYLLLIKKNTNSINTIITVTIHYTAN